MSGKRMGPQRLAADYHRSARVAPAGGLWEGLVGAASAAMLFRRIEEHRG
ncbi:hypothetical protein ACFPPA_10950 [Rhodanobacter ginsengisoli]|uniref:Uncharacterized protein n=1 Tax=Rhodanobacter ginsengisoli TaxID=418646 RepID=A0ABW0QN87_9GAMM